MISLIPVTLTWNIWLSISLSLVWSELYLSVSDMDKVSDHCILFYIGILQLVHLGFSNQVMTFMCTQYNQNTIQYKQNAKVHLNEVIAHYAH